MKQVGIMLLAGIWAAIAIVFTVQQISTNGASLFLALGRLQWKLGMRDIAIVNYLKACERNLDEESLSTYINAMRVSGRGDEVDKGISSLRASNSNEHVLKTLVTFYIERKDFARAKQYCDNWVALAPKSADAYLVRARVNEELKRDRDAETDYMKSNTLMQSDQAVTGLVRVRQRLVWSDNAYSQMMDLEFDGDRNNPVDKLTHALKLSLGAENEQAFAVYDDLVKHKQFLPATYFGRGKMHFRLRRFDSALQDFALAELHLKKVAPTGAIEYTKIRMVGFTGNTIKSTSLDQIYLFRARALLALNRCTEALVEIDKAIAISNSPGEHWVRGQIHRSMGMMAEAKKDDEAVTKAAESKVKTGKAQVQAQTLFYMMAE